MAKKSGTSSGSSDDATLANHAARVKALLTEVERELEAMGLDALTDDEREHSNGRLRANEQDAMRSVLDAVDAQPGVFASLAASDGGRDPDVVETAPARAALARRELLAPIGARIKTIWRDVADDMLHAGEVAKDLTVPAYGILRANVGSNAALRKKGAKATSFYGHGPKLRAARTKRKARAEKPGK